MDWSEGGEVDWIGWELHGEVTIVCRGWRQSQVLTHTSPEYVSVTEASAGWRGVRKDTVEYVQSDGLFVPSDLCRGWRTMSAGMGQAGVCESISRPATTSCILLGDLVSYSYSFLNFELN